VRFWAILGPRWLSSQIFRRASVNELSENLVGKPIFAPKSPQRPSASEVLGDFGAKWPLLRTFFCPKDPPKQCFGGFGAKNVRSKGYFGPKSPQRPRVARFWAILGPKWGGTRGNPPRRGGVTQVLAKSQCGHPSYFCDHFSRLFGIPPKPLKMAFAYTYFSWADSGRPFKTPLKTSSKTSEKWPLRTPFFSGVLQNPPKTRQCYCERFCWGFLGPPLKPEKRPPKMAQNPENPQKWLKTESDRLCEFPNTNVFGNSRGFRSTFSATKTGFRENAVFAQYVQHPPEHTLGCRV